MPVAKEHKEPQEKTLKDMTPDDLITQRNRVENAIDGGAIIDPIQIAQAMSYVREIDLELLERNHQMPITEFSTTTLKHWVLHNQESHIQLSVLEDELCRRKKK